MNILIICAFGASSGILKRKLMEEMKNKGLEGSVEAFSVEDLDTAINGKDIVLVAPQLRISYDEIVEQVGGKVPVSLIKSVDYGMMNAKNILDKCVKLLEK